MKFRLQTIAVLVGGALALNAYAYTPGTYTSEVQGNGGPMPVTVTFSQDKIESITVGANKETNGIGTVAIEQLPGRIVKTQSLGIDGLSGATVTSTAIFTAVANCVKQAGGDAEALKNVKVAAPAASEKTEQADVIVVGAGAAGQVATVRAEQLGAKVILVEKQPFAGGASAVNGGGLITQGSQVQKQAGVTDDSPELMVKDFLANGHDLNDKRMLELYASKIGPTIDWVLSDAGMKLDTELGLHKMAEHSRPRIMYWVGRAQGANNFLKDAVKKSGAEVLYNTKAEELIYKDGKVVGVKAKATDGTDYTLLAPAVILTTGGYGANKDMLQGALKSALYYGVKSSNGEGHQMAMAIGAKTQMMELGKVYPNGIEVGPGLAKSTIYCNRMAIRENSGILVNKAGKRFINEEDTNHNIKEAEVREGGKVFILMDQKTFDAFQSKISFNGITPEEIKQWLANDGKSAPILVKGNTIEEVAAKAGVDGKELVKTVARYNSFVEKGKDDDFNRIPEYMKSKISDKGPYYIIEQQPRFATTMGGLVTTDKMQVVDQSDKPIPGLFAAGETVGGAQGDDSPPGGNMGWAYTSGKYAAEMAVESIKK